VDGCLCPRFHARFDSRWRFFRRVQSRVCRGSGRRVSGGAQAEVTDDGYQETSAAVMIARGGLSLVEIPFDGDCCSIHYRDTRALRSSQHHPVASNLSSVMPWLTRYSDGNGCTVPVLRTQEIAPSPGPGPELLRGSTATTDTCLLPRHPDTQHYQTKIRTERSLSNSTNKTGATILTAPLRYNGYLNILSAHDWL
jgi:hypothetical protein